MMMVFSFQSEEADSLPGHESANLTDKRSSGAEDEQESTDDHNLQSPDTIKEEHKENENHLPVDLPRSDFHNIIDEGLGAKQSTLETNEASETPASNHRAGHEGKSPEAAAIKQLLLPELAQAIKKEFHDGDYQPNGCDDALGKPNGTTDTAAVPGESQLFGHFYPSHSDCQSRRQNKTMDAETEDEEDVELKFRPNNQNLDCDDISDGFSSPGSKVASSSSPCRPKSNSSERSSSNAADFRSHRSSSSSFSFASSTSQIAASPSYNVESHVNRLQSFVESLTTPVNTLKSKVAKEGRNFIQSPSPSAKMPANKDNFRNYECCTSKTSLLSCYRGSYLNSMIGGSSSHNEAPTEEQPLDLSLKKYQHRSDRSSFDVDMDGNLSGSASLLTLQSKFGENSPMLSSPSSKFHRVDFYNGLGYGLFKQSMYDSSKQKGFPLGSSNSFDARSPSLSSCSSSKPMTNEISSLKQMVTSCETGQPSSQTKLPIRCDLNKLPLKRPRSGTSERSSEASHEKNLQNPTHQPSQHTNESKKSKTSVQDRRLEKLQKKKIQNFTSSRSDLPNDSSSITAETSQNLADKKKVHTNQRCSCGVTYSNLFQLTVHVEETGHTPESLELDTAEDLPKLVRGQDVWISQGQEQTEMILRCIQCRTSFRSLPELTVHMVKTKHYINIVKADGDFSDPNNRTWAPKPILANDQPKSTLSQSSSHTPTTMSNSSSNNSPCSFKSGSQSDKKVTENIYKSKNKLSDSENSCDKIKSDGKNPLKFGITEMLDFPSYKKMLKKMTENCEEIKPVDGVALTLFHNRLDQERMNRQVKNDVRHHSSAGTKLSTDEVAYQKFDTRASCRNTSKSTLSKSHQQETGGCKLSSNLSEKYLTPKFSFSSGKNVSSNDESEPGESKPTSMEKKSLELVSPLPYGIDGASSLKAMENFIESSFSKISQSLHTPSSLPFPSFASRCLITAPVLENVYNNAFLRDAKVSIRNANNNLNCIKPDGKKRSLDQSSSFNEDLLKKRRKLHSHGLVTTSQGFSQTSISPPKNELEHGESRLAISSESSTDGTENIRHSLSMETNRQVRIKEEKDSEKSKGEICSPSTCDNESYLSEFSSSIDTMNRSTSIQTSYSSSLDSIKMLASRFFSSDPIARTFQRPTTPTSFPNRKKELYHDPYNMDYASRQGFLQNPSTASDNVATYNHHISSFNHPPFFDQDPPNLIRIKPEPQDDEVGNRDEMRIGRKDDQEGKDIVFHRDLKGECHERQLEQKRTSVPENKENQDVDKSENNTYQEKTNTDHHHEEEEEEDQTSTNSLHLSRCQPSSFPINESLSTTVRSCQQVQ